MKNNMKIKKFNDFNESQGTSLNQWELRKLINKKAKIKKIGKDYYGQIKVDDEIIYVYIDRDYLNIKFYKDVTVNNVWDSLDLLNVSDKDVDPKITLDYISQKNFNKLKIENVLTE